MRILNGLASVVPALGGHPRPPAGRLTPAGVHGPGAERQPDVHHPEGDQEVDDHHRRHRPGKGARHG